MKYFNYLWAETNKIVIEKHDLTNDNWDENAAEYWKEFSHIEKRLPAKFLKTYYQCEYFHDAQLEEIKLGKKLGKAWGSFIEMHMDFYGKKYTISYYGVERVLYERPLNHNSFLYPEYNWGLQIGYDEFLAVNDSVLSHEILFNNGDTLLIHFSKIRIHKKPD